MRALRFQVGIGSLLTGLALAWGGCVSRTILPASVNGGFGFDSDGVVVLRSQMRHAVAVRVVNENYSHDADELPAFSILVTNGGRMPISFSAGNVSATCGEQLIEVLDARDVIRRVREDQMRGLLPKPAEPPESATPIAGPVQLPLPTSATGPTSLRDGSAPVEPPPAWGPLLRYQEIAPGQLGGGVIKLGTTGLKAGVPLKLSVTLGDEIHEFFFEVGR